MDTGWLTQGRPRGSLSALSAVHIWSPWQAWAFTTAAEIKMCFLPNKASSPQRPVSAMATISSLSSTPLLSLSIHRCCVRQDARWTQVHTRSLACFPRKAACKAIYTFEGRLKALGRLSKRGAAKHCRAGVRVELFLRVVGLGLKLGEPLSKLPVSPLIP